MNKVMLIGKLSDEPSQRGEHVVAFTVMAKRKFLKENTKDVYDFVKCVCFGKEGDFVMKYFHKGKKIAIEGRIQTGSYVNKEGKKVYTTDVVVETAEFVEESRNNRVYDPEGARHTMQSPDSTDAGLPENTDGFMSVPDGAEPEGLPFD